MDFTAPQSIELPKELKKQKNLAEIPKGLAWLLHGEPKTGKTFLASTFPKPLLVEIDPKGAEYVPQAYEYTPKSLDEVSAIPSAFQDDDFYKTVILDTVDSLAGWITDEICNREGVKYIGKIEYGQGRDELNSRLTRLIDNYRRACLQTNKTLIIIMHGRAEHKKSLQLSEPLERWIRGQVSVIGYCHKQLVQGRMQYYVDYSGGSGNTTAGSRHPLLSSIGNLSNNYYVIEDEFNKYGIKLKTFYGDDKKPGILAWYKSMGISKEQYDNWLRHKNILALGKVELEHVITLAKEHKNNKAKLEAFKKEVLGA